MAETLDPKTEFEEPEPQQDQEAPVVSVVPEEAAAATKSELAELKTQLQTKLAVIDSLSSRVAVVDKLQELFTGKPEDPRDAFIKKEILRLAPELNDVAKIKEVLPLVLQALQGAADEKLLERADTAQEYLRGHMKDTGLDTKDEDSVAYMEEAVTNEIKRNKELLSLWTRGRTKDAVAKAYEKVESKLFAPVRAQTKRSAVRTITESPKAGPKGGAPAPVSLGGKKLDLTDTSRENTKKIHEAAFERLQELTEG